ncbi:hypothetical protein ACTMU2_37390 [Cupriavidus basilensis]
MYGDTKSAWAWRSWIAWWESGLVAREPSHTIDLWIELLRWPGPPAGSCAAALHRQARRFEELTISRNAGSPTPISSGCSD